MDTIKIAGSEHFSSAFNTAIGLGNVVDVYGLEDTDLLKEVFAGLVEMEAVEQCQNGVNEHLRVMKFNNGGHFDGNGTLHWRTVNAHSGTTFIELLGALLTLSRADAITALASIVNLDFENIKELASDKHVAETKGLHHPQKNVPQWIYLHRLPEGGAHAELVALHCILGNAQQIIGAIAIYRLNKREFCLPATVGNKVLCLGKYRPTAHFLNQHLIDVNPFVPVLLCQDMRTALALQRIIEQTVPEYRPKVIVTAHLGTDLFVLPWGYFYGHDVVFVCAPTKQCMAAVKGYEAQVRGAGAKSFRVYPGFLLHSTSDSKPSDSATDGLPSNESKLLHTAVTIEAIERPALFLQRVFAEAIPYADFVLWGQNLGVFKRPKGSEQDPASNDTLALPIFNNAGGGQMNQPMHISDVTLQHLLPERGLVMVHGAKNAGKSFVVLEFIKAKVIGKNAFGLFPLGEATASTLLLDSETPQNLLKSRFEQHNLADAIENGFYPHTKTDLSAAGFSPATLTTPKLRTALEDEIQTVGIKLICLDNLTTLCPPGAIYQQKIVGDLLDWTTYLGAQGVTCVLVHHSHKDEKNPENAAMRGSREFSIRAHTEVVVIGQEQIVADDTLGPKTAQAAASKSGLTLGLHVRFCKMASVLEGVTFWLHLPLNGDQWELLDITDKNGKIVVMDNAQASGANDVAEPSSFALAPAPAFEPSHSVSLTAKESKVLNFAIEQGGKVQTGKVATHLDISDNTARSILQSLCDNGRMQVIGEGPNTTYSVVSE